MNNQYKHNPDTLVFFGEILDKKLQEISQSKYYRREVARELDVSNSTISRIIRGEMVDIKLSTFLALCKYVDMTDEEILRLYNFALDRNLEKTSENEILKQKILRIREIIDE